MLFAVRSRQSAHKARYPRSTLTHHHSPQTDYPRRITSRAERELVCPLRNTANAAIPCLRDSKVVCEGGEASGGLLHQEFAHATARCRELSGYQALLCGLFRLVFQEAGFTSFCGREECVFVRTRLPTEQASPFRCAFLFLPKFGQDQFDCRSRSAARTYHPVW